MKHLPIKRDINNNVDREIYYLKLYEISNILEKVEIDLYYKLSELIRGKDIEPAEIQMISHRSYVNKYVSKYNIPSNDHIIKLLHNIRSGLCATRNPSNNYFYRKYHDHYKVGKLLKEKLNK